MSASTERQLIEEQITQIHEEYEGETIATTKDGLLKFIELDALEYEGANYRAECAGMWQFFNLLEQIPDHQLNGYFAYPFSDLGPVRQFLILGPQVNEEKE